MVSLLVVVISLLAFLAVYLGAAIVLGLIVHWCVPSIDLSMASLLAGMGLLTLCIACAILLATIHPLTKVAIDSLSDSDDLSDNDDEVDLTSHSSSRIVVSELGAAIAKSLREHQRPWAEDVNVERRPRGPKKKH